MRNYAETDYAANKNAEGIVYRFADKTVEITLEDYLRENPDKTAADFAEIKALSDEDYYERNKVDYRQTWKNVSIGSMDGSHVSYVESPENEIVERDEQSSLRQWRNSVAHQALAKLTETQKRRYFLYHIKELSTWKIAELEGANQKSVYESLQAAEKKIKKILAGK